MTDNLIISIENQYQTSILPENQMKKMQIQIRKEL